MSILISFDLILEYKYLDLVGQLRVQIVFLSIGQIKEIHYPHKTLLHLKRIGLKK